MMLGGIHPSITEDRDASKRLLGVRSVGQKLLKIKNTIYMSLSASLKLLAVSDASTAEM